MRQKRLQSTIQTILSYPKKTLILFVVRITMILLIIFLVYYIFFLAPKLALPNAYLKTQEIFAEHRSNLIQNRLAIVSLAQLSPNSNDLFNKEAELLKQLKQTNEKGIKSLEKDQNLPAIKGVPNEFINFLNNDLATEFPILLSKENQILKEQQDLISSLINLNSITANLLLYNAAEDLGVKEGIDERVKAAKEGIKKINEELDSFENKSKEIDLLQREIQKTQNIFNIKELIQQFTVLKERVLSAQFALIRSDSSVKLLTRQTNLILEYDFWLKKISIYQSKLSIK